MKKFKRLKWDSDMIRTLMRKYKWNQTDLAMALGTTQQTISTWVTGSTKPCSAYNILLTELLEKGSL